MSTTMAWTGNRSWTTRRLLISAFLLFHLTATAIWVLPICPIRNRLVPYLEYYMLPTGMWQAWAMFAPDPIHDTLMLEAEVIDSGGVRYGFRFPRMADYTWWQGIPRFRYAKYTANMAAEEFALPRKYAAHHALRRLKLPESVYPVSVHIMYQMRPTPPPGSVAAADPMNPTKPYILGSFRVETPREVNP
jgi:hypothetical protein